MTKRTIFGLLAAVGVIAIAAGVWAGARGSPHPGRSVAAGQRVVRNVTLVAAPTTIKLGGRSVKTWAFNGTVPGPEIQLRAGDVLRARVENRLSAPLTIHWHGIALRNDMDGVPDVTQKAIEPGGQFVYRFTVPDPGTFFYHSHVGTELDRGLYGPLIVEPASGGGSLREVTVMLDDWIDGMGSTPDDVVEQLRSGGSSGMGNMGIGDSQSSGMSGSGSDMGDMGTMEMGGMSMGGSGASGMGDGSGMGVDAGEDARDSIQRELGTDTGDVDYPLYLINGRPPTDPATFAVKPGESVRIRFINAGSDTPFRVAVGGNRLRVVATDGYPVRPVTAASILLGMGERYDAIVTVPRSGVFPLVARAEEKNAQAVGALRAGPGPNPRPNVTPAALGGRVLTLRQLHATRADALPPGKPDRAYVVPLTGNMRTHRWGIGGPGMTGMILAVRRGERVRLVLENHSMMWHPIHLHDHTFQVVTSPAPGPRKDTVIVPPMGRVPIDFIADNPGRWALHCHNIYHAEAGMMTVVSYRP